MAAAIKKFTRVEVPRTGQVLDDRFLREEVYELTDGGADFGDDTNDRTPWIDLAGVVFMHVHCHAGAFRGTLSLEYSASPEEPDNDTDQEGPRKDIAMASGGWHLLQQDPNDSPWGKWVRGVVSVATTDPTADGPLKIQIYIRRLESKRG